MSMLRVCLSQSPRSVASSSTHSLLHTSAVRLAKKNDTSKKLNLSRRAVRAEHATANAPSIILGTRPGEEHKWENCDLRKVLVTEKDLAKLTGDKGLDFVDQVLVPKFLAHGIGAKTERKLMFETLPALSAETLVIHRQEAMVGKIHDMHDQFEDETEREIDKANMFAKVVDLRNANAQGIAYENRRRIVEAFSAPGKTGDTGRSEVQAALLTAQIRNLWEHLNKHKRDVGNIRGLRMLVHQRAKILKYLKRTQRRRYDVLLKRLALEPDSVEGELIV